MKSIEGQKGCDIHSAYAHAICFFFISVYKMTLFCSVTETQTTSLCFVTVLQGLCTMLSYKDKMKIFVFQRQSIEWIHEIISPL